MNKLKSYIPVVISLIISFLIIGVGYNSNNDDAVKEVYKVYLDGKLLGAIKSKEDLENHINREQKDLKEEYGVKKIYVPNGIDIEKCLTHKGTILTEDQIYNKIKKKKSFTIKGYVVSIVDSEGKEIKINILKKDLFDKAVKKVLNAFVDSKQVNDYKNDTQAKIETTGSLIENIYIDQTVTIKESYISTDELIFQDETTLTKYLLFGSLDKDQEYVVKPGDTIETVAFNNSLGVEEFLIVNPEFTSSNNLLSVGQTVSVALIDPILNIVVEKHIVEDMDKQFETIEKEDSSLYVGTTKTETEGVNGVQRVTQKVKYVNGEAQPAIITNVEVIKEPINKVVLKGTKSYIGGAYIGGGVPATTSGMWGWPTISPYIITSEFKYRWGKLHAGIDISGCGYGSPVYAVRDGVVVRTGNNPGADGIYAIIDHGDGYYSIYMHMASVIARSGQTVKRGQVIGTMGNSGRSTGTHLHLGIYVGGEPYRGGSPINPLSVYR